MNTYSATLPATLTNANGSYIGKGYTLKTGNLANPNFFAIPINAKNKLAALVTVNYVSSAAAMFQRKSGLLTKAPGWSQYQAYDIGAGEFSSRGGRWNLAFETIPTQTNCIPRDDLENAKIPELSPAYTTQLETDWYWCVLNYGSANTPSSYVINGRCG